MIKALIKVTNEMRFETIEDVKAYQEEVRQAASSGNYQLSSYTWTEKFIKMKGEIVDSYYHVKYTLLFNDIKEPETYLRDISYNMVGTNEQEF